MSVRLLRPVLVTAFGSVLAACSLVVPLGDEYTFAEICDEIPTQEEICAGLCGEITACGVTFVCGGCPGELSCGADNVCECVASPCAAVDFSEGDASEQRIVDVAVDPEGNVYVAGNFRGTIELGDDTFTSPDTTRFDIFLFKMDPSGQVLWSRAYGDVNSGVGNTDQSVVAIATDSIGNVVLVGYSYVDVDLGDGTIPAAGDMLLAKLDPDGDLVFAAAYGTELTIDGRDVAIDPASQDILVTGSSTGRSSSGRPLSPRPRAAATTTSFSRASPPMGRPRPRSAMETRSSRCRTRSPSRTATCTSRHISTARSISAFPIPSSSPPTRTTRSRSRG